MSTIANMMIRLGVHDLASTDLQKVGTEAEAAGTKVEGFGQKAGEVKESVVGSFGKMAAAAGLVSGGLEAGEFLKGAIESAENLTKAQDGLSLAIEKTGGNVNVLRPEFDAVAKSAADFGINQVTATQGLQKATLIAGNAEAGLRAYREALVISKATGQDFNAVLLATSKGQQGVTTSLQRYGIAVAKGTPGQAQLNMVMKTFGGQAAANTTESEKLRARFENFQATLGQKLLPLFDKFITILGDAGTWLADVAKWLQKNEDVVLPLAAAIGAITLAITAWKVATAIWTTVTELATAAQEGLNVAMESNPIGLVVLALVGLGAALMVLWKRSETFRDIVTGTWNELKNVTVAVVDFIKEHWRAGVIALATILLGPLGAIVALIATHWGTVKHDATAAWDTVKGIVTGAVNGVKDTVSTVFGTLDNIISKAGGAIGKAAGVVKAAFQPIITAINAITSAVNTAIGAIGKMLGLLGKAGSILHKAGSFLSHIPGFATGVTNYPGGLAVVGEHGPELVNLPRGADVLTNAQSRRALGNGAGGHGVIVQNMNVRSDEDVRLWARDLARRLGA